jgi:hypothetical protein
MGLVQSGHKMIEWNAIHNIAALAYPTWFTMNGNKNVSWLTTDYTKNLHEECLGNGELTAVGYSNY